MFGLESVVNTVHMPGQQIVKRPVVFFHLCKLWFMLADDTAEALIQQQLRPERQKSAMISGLRERFIWFLISLFGRKFMGTRLKIIIQLRRCLMCSIHVSSSLISHFDLICIQHVLIAYTATLNRFFQTEFRTTEVCVHLLKCLNLIGSVV